MISTYDPDYLETKSIMLGETEMKSEFRPLADWVDQTYGVKTINIVYDFIEEGKRPRLELCFEFEREKNVFMNRDSVNYDGAIQTEIRNKFTETIEAQGLSDQYPSDTIWTIYGAFDVVARQEINSSIAEELIDALKEEINDDNLWVISRIFAGVTFMVYTDAQVKQYEKDGIKKKWSEKYFDLLTAYDTFGYFKKETFEIMLDSKENFDKNYDSNWYYFYK